MTPYKYFRNKECLKHDFDICDLNVVSKLRVLLNIYSISMYSVNIQDPK